MKQQPSFKHFSDATLRGSKWAYGCDNSKVAAQRNEASIKRHDGIVLRDHQRNKDEHARDLPTKTPRMLTRLEYRPKTTPGKNCPLLRSSQGEDGSSSL
jgi:hypothetical protein